VYAIAKILGHSFKLQKNIEDGSVAKNTWEIE